MPILIRSTGYALAAFPALSVIRSLTLNAVALATICMIIHLPTQAGRLSDENLKRRLDAVVGLMSFTLTPDVTTGSLSLSDGPTDNPDIALTTGGRIHNEPRFPFISRGYRGIQPL